MRVVDAEDRRPALEAYSLADHSEHFREMLRYLSLCIATRSRIAVMNLPLRAVDDRIKVVSYHLSYSSSRSEKVARTFLRLVSQTTSYPHSVSRKIAHDRSCR